MCKKIKIGFAVMILLLICFSVFVCVSTPFVSIYNLSNILNANFDAVDYINKNKIFGRFVNAEYDNQVMASDGNEKPIVNLKLFNAFTIKKFSLNADDIDVYAGGDIVGFSLNGDGVVVIGFGKVSTVAGEFDTIENSDIKKGDIIKEIEDEKIKSVADICRVVNKEENKNKPLGVKLKRNDGMVETTIKSALDKYSGIYKLGLWVKDDVSGIGTLTFVKKENNRFGALGHAICDGDTKTIYNIDSGEMYPCTVLGIKKGTKGKAGELKGLFFQGKNNKLALVDNNSEAGVFGNMIKEVKDKDILKAGGRLYAKPGRAYIKSAVDGELKDYEIEIIKTNYQSSSNEKSMVIRVTDKDLLRKTGGIIQGMSGSPIIQNGYVVGAVTHVFINDPTKGFGIYLDWMINQ